MIQSNNQQPENKPAKKFWQKPDFYILDSDNVNGAADPGVYEGSFAPNGLNVPNSKGAHYVFWINNGNRSRAYYYS